MKPQLELDWSKWPYIQEEHRLREKINKFKDIKKPNILNRGDMVNF